MSGLSESSASDSPCRAWTRGRALPRSPASNGYALGIDDYDDSVEPALAPCPFGVERGRGIKVRLCLCLGET
jgi:hypothetical protein